MAKDKHLGDGTIADAPKAPKDSEGVEIEEGAIVITVKEFTIRHTKDVVPMGTTLTNVELETGTHITVRNFTCPGNDHFYNEITILSSNVRVVF